MKRITIVSLTCVLALLGCASQPEWSKPGVSSQDVAAALADCQGVARDATRRDTDIMTDIMASRGADWQRTGVLETQQQMFDAGYQARTKDIVNRCMIGKGFVPGGN